MYRIVFRTRFDRIFKKLDSKTQQSIVDALETLTCSPFENPNVKMLSGAISGACRLRVGRWRILYLLITKQNTIEVIDLFLKKSSSDYQRKV